MSTRTARREGGNGLTRCNKGLNRNECATCPFITLKPSEVIKKVTIGNGKEIEVKGKLNCKAPGFVIVLWSMKAPEKAYLGSSSRRPKDRLREHKYSIEEGKDVAVANHFHETRSDTSDLVFRPVLKVKSSSPWVIKHFESKLMNELNLVEEGVNRIIT